MTAYARGQGIDRESLSGESVATQLRQSGESQRFNLQFGPVGLRINANIVTQYNDNINLANTNGIGDFITTPSIGLNAHWAVTDLNAIDLNLELGYEMYLNHSQYNSLLLSPGSEAQFNFFVGEVALNAHDSFSYQEDPVPFAQLSNTVRLKRFMNDVGVSATWDMDPITVIVDYEHQNLWVDDTIYNYLTNQTDTIAPQFTYKINHAVTAGFSVSVTDTRYDKKLLNDSVTVSVGPTLQAQISKNLSINASGGGYIGDYSSSGVSPGQNVLSYYGSLGVTHRINDAITESLTAGHEFIPGLTSDYTERAYVTYTATWQPTKQISTGASLFYENLDDSEATVHQTSDRFGIGLSANDNLTERVTLNFNYQYLLKNSSIDFDSYEQNVVSFGLAYNF